MKNFELSQRQIDLGLVTIGTFMSDEAVMIGMPHLESTIIIEIVNDDGVCIRLDSLYNRHASARADVVWPISITVTGDTAKVNGNTCQLDKVGEEVDIVMGDIATKLAEEEKVKNPDVTEKEVTIKMMKLFQFSDESIAEYLETLDK